MFYFPPTSLAPAVVALAQFLNSSWPNFWWYPYWYLGNPYQYLIGPVVPFLLFTGTKILPIGFETLYIILIVLAQLIGAVGIYLLAKSFNLPKKQAAICGLFYILLPASLLLLQFQNGLNHLSFAFLPYVVLLYRTLLYKSKSNLQGNSIIFDVILSFLLAFVLLIDIAVLLPITVSFIALLVAVKVPQAQRTVVKTIMILALALSIATLWYTPHFWWVILTNPSLGGIPLANLMGNLLKISLNLIPLILAVVIVRFKAFKIHPVYVFSLIFLGTFLSLSLARFMLDPDFVVDWISFGLEIQFATSILVGGLFVAKNNLKIASFFIVLISLTFDFYLITNFTNSTDKLYQNTIINIVKPHVGDNQRMFLSGSPVFWINAQLNLIQVRGGVDQAAIHRFFNQAAFQIREGQDATLTQDWLTALGISYILVHEPGSPEYFHDFKNPDKFTNLKLVSDHQSNKLYKNNNDLGVARVADASLLKAPKPADGADSNAVRAYVKTFKKPLPFTQTANSITVKPDLQKDEVISLALSFDPNWKITKGRGTVTSDNFSNLVIIPQDREITLTYQKDLSSAAIPLIFSIMALVMLWHFDKIYPYWQNFSSRLGFSFEEDEE